MSNVANKLRVLFVDDEAPIREVMKIELPRMGHEATICEDGRTALEVLEKHVFDAAIIDLRMPGLSGWDVIDYLREHSPETVCVISTGHGDRDDAIRAIRMVNLPRRCERARRDAPRTSSAGRERATTAPAASTANEAPSNTTSSCAPVRCT